MRINLQKNAPTWKGFSLLIFALIFSTKMIAQPINEGFNNVASLFTSGWAQQNLSTPVGTNPNWVQGNNTVFPANSLPDTSYIACNYNSVAGAATISNWLFTPNRTFQNGDVITFYSRCAGGNYPDNLQVRLSTNGASVNVGTTNVSVGDYTTLLLEINPTLSTTAYPAVWTQYTITITGLAAPTSGRIAFRYFVTNGGPTGANSDYIGIDDYVYTPFGGATSPEVSISRVTPGEYTVIPQSQVSSFPVSATVNNSGTGSAGTVTLTTSVYKLPNVATPVYAQTGSTTNLAAGANTVINLPAYTPAAPTLGSYQFVHVISGNTGSVANDTFRYAVVIDNDEYARDNGTSVQGVGAGNTASVIIGNNFQITANTIMDSVLFFCYPGAAGLGDTVRVRISSTVAGVPSNTAFVGNSNIYQFTVADTSGRPIKLPVTNLTGGALSLTPGTYFVGLEKFRTGDNYGLQCANSLFTANTVYANINNGAFSPLNTLIAGFNFTPIVRAYFRNACAVTATSSSTQSTCTASNGTATATPVGATAPITYTWSNGGNTASISALAAGTYTVTVNDANGCSATSSTTVTANNLTLNVGTTSTQATCTAANGTATSATSSGTAPYTYTWSTGGNTASINNLAAGSYTVTITDLNGCRGSSTVNVTSNSVSVTSTSSTTNSACGGSTGSATVTATAGTAPYTYAWSNGGNSSSINNISAGTYSVTITDANGCVGVRTGIVVSNPNAPTASVSSSTNPLCNGNATGTATGTANGGTAPYSYVWSNGQTGPTATGLAAGSYTFTVTDASSCSGVSSVTITQPSALNVIMSSPLNVSCNGGSNGSIGLTTGGTGTGPYTFLWSNGQTSQSIINVGAGVYTVTVVDQNGCATTGSQTVTEPTAINSSVSVTDASGAATNDGSVNLTVNGGTPTYTYTWSNGSSTEDLNGVNPGTYTVTITDANGCTSVQSATVSQPTSISEINGLAVNLYPNPTTDLVTLSLSLTQSSDIEIQVLNVTGQLITTIQETQILSTSYQINTADWSAGVYVVRVQAGTVNQSYRLIKK